MNRRKALKNFLGKGKTKSEKSSATTVSFAPYTGPWGVAEAAHLLRRALLGPTKAQITQAVADGLPTTIANLFTIPPPPDPPIYFDFDNDPNVPNGETWVDTLESPVNGLAGRRRQSLWAWMYKNMWENQGNIQEKMFLFWHNHFVVSNTNLARKRWTYVNLLRENVLGNFKTLTENITIDPSMLGYLNGQQNSVNGPNENYARELLELFTIGKGAAAGPGDYTTYTEDDVVEIARALTGWRAFDVNNNNEPTTASFIPARHDTGDKQLSFRFNDVVITNEMENEYKTVIDIIFQQEQTARFLCRKLYRWFVHSIVDDNVENTIIAPMSQVLIADNFEVSGALQALLSSQHFYDEAIRGCMINNPIEHLFKLVNTFEVAPPSELFTKYAVSRGFQLRMAISDMAILDHPTVAGWKAYYQSPNFDKLWINAVSLPLREDNANRFIQGFNISGHTLVIDVLDFAASLSNPTNPEDMILEIAGILFAQPITDEQLAALKDILIPGLPDYEWTIEYGDYLGGDLSLETAIENKLKSLIGAMIKMPEFYLI